MRPKGAAAPAPKIGPDIEIRMVAPCDRPLFIREDEYKRAVLDLRANFHGVIEASRDFSIECLLRID